MATCGQNWPGVIGCVNFAGDAGGKTTQVPSLWLYAENDLYWGAEPPKQWHKAHVAEFFPAPPVDTDRHRLLTVGGLLWSPSLNAWLKKHGP